MIFLTIFNMVWSLIRESKQEQRAAMISNSIMNHTGWRMEALSDEENERIIRAIRMRKEWEHRNDRMNQIAEISKLPVGSDEWRQQIYGMFDSINLD